MTTTAPTVVIITQTNKDNANVAHIRTLNSSRNLKEIRPFSLSIIIEMLKKLIENCRRISVLQIKYYFSQSGTFGYLYLGILIKVALSFPALVVQLSVQTNIYCFLVLKFLNRLASVLLVIFVKLSFIIIIKNNSPSDYSIPPG